MKIYYDIYHFRYFMFLEKSCVSLLFYTRKSISTQLKLFVGFEYRLSKNFRKKFNLQEEYIYISSNVTCGRYSLYFYYLFTIRARYLIRRCVKKIVYFCKWFGFSVHVGFLNTTACLKIKKRISLN